MTMDRHDDTLDGIVALEWDMFQAVNEGGPRASCQNDGATFEGMRRAQFEAWSEDVRESYLMDLTDAVHVGRNLVNEKYIHMMKHHSPSQYEALSKLIPMPDDTVCRLAQDVSDRLMAQTEALSRRFPNVSSAGRPLRSTQDSTVVVSVESYQLGELLTYSARTLTLLRRWIVALEEQGHHLARSLLENSVRFYGYASLEEAETAMLNRIKARSGEAS